MKDEYLFSGGQLDGVVANHERLVKAEVETLDQEHLLNTSPDALIEYLVEKYRLDTPRLHEDRITASEEEAKVDVTGDFRYMTFDGRRTVVPGVTVRFFIPFSGDSDLFKFRPSMFTPNPPRAEVRGSELVIARTGVDLAPDALRADLNRELQAIRQYLSSVESTAKPFNDSLPGIARQSVEVRRQRLLNAAGMVASLGFPLRARPDAARTFAPPECSAANRSGLRLRPLRRSRRSLRSLSTTTSTSLASFTRPRSSSNATRPPSPTWRRSTCAITSCCNSTATTRGRRPGRHSMPPARRTS